MPRFPSVRWRSALSLAILLAVLMSVPASAGPKVLMVYPNSFGANANLSRNQFEEYGWEIVTAGMTESVLPCGWASNLSLSPITVDSIFTDIGPLGVFDAVIFMTSSGSLTEFTENSLALSKIRGAIDNNVVFVFHCATLKILLAARRVEGHRVCGPYALRTDILSAGGSFLGDDVPPVVSDNIVTSVRNMYFNPETCDVIAATMEKYKGLNAGGKK